MKKLINKTIYLVLFAVVSSFFAVEVKSQNNGEQSANIQSKPVKHKPDIKMIKQAEKLVKVTVTPSITFSYDLMKEGVIQHLDRDYTYDFIPEELRNGLLFQGIHRPPAGTVINIELLVPAKIYFFFHYKVDGGYSEIFEKMKDWERCKEAPQYDIHNGDHGLNMIMYRFEADTGTFVIPPTVKDRACFSFVIRTNE